MGFCHGSEVLKTTVKTSSHAADRLTAQGRNKPNPLHTAKIRPRAHRASLARKKRKWLKGITALPAAGFPFFAVLPSPFVSCSQPSAHGNVHLQAASLLPRSTGWCSVSPLIKKDANSIAVHTKDGRGWKDIQVKDATCFFFLKALLVVPPRVLLPATRH